MFRHVPNALTVLRLLLAAVFFGMLSYYQHESTHPRHGDTLWLNIAFVIYLIALATDFLDGFLARRWKVEGAFGRIVDPFVDKVLVLGSFIFFAGRNFTIPAQSAMNSHDVMTITGISPWMVVLILARELLITSLRGASENDGHDFGAQFSGKLKMVLQSITILVILIYVNYFIDKDAVRIFRDVCIWIMLAVTVFSGLLYVQRGIALYRRGTAKPKPAASTKPPVTPTLGASA